MAAYRHVTCRLTAKDRDQLRNRVWATFTFTATYFDFIFCTATYRYVLQLEMRVCTFDMRN